MTKRKGKKRNCSLYKSETNVYQHLKVAMNMVWPWFVAQCWEKYHTKKTLWMSVCVSCIFIRD